MKHIFLGLVLIAALLLAACTPTPPVQYDAGTVGSSKCVHPESDNSFRWGSTSCVYIDTHAFTVTAQVYGDIQNHTELHGEGSGSGVMVGGIGSYSSYSRLWQDGKGMLPVTIISISPTFHDVIAGSTIILKTSDLKAMALDVGAQVTFICNEDVEVISPIEDLQVLTTDRITYELDDCRMASPIFTSAP